MRDRESFLDSRRFEESSVTWGDVVVKLTDVEAVETSGFADELQTLKEAGVDRINLIFEADGSFDHVAAFIELPKHPEVSEAYHELFVVGGKRVVREVISSPSLTNEVVSDTQVKVDFPEAAWQALEKIHQELGGQ